MIRPILTELALFLTPFALYALFLWATKRGGVLDLTNWPLTHVLYLLIAAFLLVIAASSCWRNGVARRRARPTFRRISRTASSCRERPSRASQK